MSNSTLVPSESCVNLVKHFEGLHKLQKDGSVKAYKCPAGIWTIGYGHTEGVTEDMVITKEEAEDLLLEDLTDFSKQVLAVVRVPMSQAQFDALVSFTYNVGIGNLKASTLLKKLNAGDYDGAAAEFPKWNKARVDGQLQPLAGLTRRRTAEAALFAMDAAVGVDGVVQVQAPQEEPVKPLTKSKTMAGATIAGAGVVLTEAAKQLEPVVHMSETVKQIFIVLTVIGIGIVAYARWKDHKDGVK